MEQGKQDETSQGGSSCFSESPQTVAFVCSNAVASSSRRSADLFEVGSVTESSLRVCSVQGKKKRSKRIQITSSQTLVLPRAVARSSHATRVILQPGTGFFYRGPENALSLSKSRFFAGCKTAPRSSFVPLSIRQLVISQSVLQQADTVQKSTSDDAPPPFGIPGEPDGVQKVLLAIPSSLRTAFIGGVVGAAVVGGAALVGSIPPKNVPKAAAGVVLAGGAIAGARVAVDRKKRLAILALRNAFVGNGVSAANDATIDSLSKEYGVDVKKEFANELAELYGQYLLYCLWDPEIRRDEADNLEGFRDTFALSADTVADTHNKVSRALLRQVEERRGVSKRRLIGKLLYLNEQAMARDGDMILRYVRSCLKDTFSVSEFQLNKIRREVTGDKYGEAMQSVLDAAAATPDATEAQFAVWIKQLYEAKHNLGIAPEEALIIFKEVALALGSSTVQHAAKAAEEFDRRGVLSDVDKLLAFRAALDRLNPTGEPLTEDPLKGCAAGTAKVVEVFKTFVTASLADRKLSEADQRRTVELQSILGVPSTTAETIYNDIAGKMFREAANTAVAEGVLNDEAGRTLVQLEKDLRLNDSLVSSILLEIYRNYLSDALRDEVLRDSDVETLGRMQKVFRIDAEVAEKMLDELAGAIYSKLAKEFLSEGVLQEYDRERLDDLAKDIRLREDKAKEILNTQAKAKLVGFASNAAGFMRANIRQMASEINRLTEYRIASNFDEVTARTDRNVETLKDLYRAYVTYALSPDLVDLPMNTTVNIGRREFEIRNLPNVQKAFGLADSEVSDVHLSLSARVFKDKVDTFLLTGHLDEAKLKELNQLRESLGIPENVAQDIINGQSRTYITQKTEEIRSKVKNTLDDIKTLQAMGVNVEKTLRERQRQQVLRDAIEVAIQRGELTPTNRSILPSLLEQTIISESESEEVITRLVRDRVKASMVQAVGSLRQGSRSEVAAQLEKMIRFFVMAPQDIDWDRRGELRQMYTAYLKHSRRDGEPTDAEAAYLVKLKEIFNFSEDDIRDLEEQAL